MIEETVGGRLAKTLDFFGVVCDLDCSDIPRPEPPDSLRLVTSSLLPKKQVQRMAGEGCAIVCSNIYKVYVQYKQTQSTLVSQGILFSVLFVFIFRL